MGNEYGEERFGANSDNPTRNYVPVSEMLEAIEKRDKLDNVAMDALAYASTVDVLYVMAIMRTFSLGYARASRIMSFLSDIRAIASEPDVGNGYSVNITRRQFDRLNAVRSGETDLDKCKAFESNVAYALDILLDQVALNFAVICRERGLNYLEMRDIIFELEDFGFLTTFKPHGGRYSVDITREKYNEIFGKR